MATTIQLLRSDIAQQRPDPGVLANGVPMVNIHESEPGLFFAARNGTLFKVGPAAVGPLAPNLSPQGSTGNTLGEMWVDTSGSNPELKFYDGTSWEPCFTGLSGTISANSVSYTRVSTGAQSTTAQAKFEETISVKDFGATGDGSTDDTADIQEAINAAAAGQAIFFPPGVYKVSSLTFSGPVVLDGAQFDSTGIVTFKSPITAPLGRIFRGGTYVFDCVITGYPEWWGAGTSESGGPATGVTNQVAIMACFAACHTTQLQVGTYLTSGTIYLETSGRTLTGAANYWNASGYNGTRIVILSASDDVIFLRTDTLSTDNTTYVRNVRIEYIQLARSSVGGAGSTSVGLRTYKIIFCEFHKIRSAEHYRPYYISGNIACNYSDCQAFASVGLQNAGAIYSGYYFDGSANIGLAGGNASVYLHGCSATTGGVTSALASYGFHLTSKYVDTFLIEPECARIDIGIYLEGDLAAPGNGQQDVHIYMPIIDVFRDAAIRVKDQKPRGIVEINGGYCAPMASAAATITSCIDFVNARGQSSISDFECVCWPLPQTAGLSIDATSRGVSVTNYKIAESETPIVISGDFNLVQATTFLGSETGNEIVDITGDRNVVSIGAWGDVATAFTDGVNVSGDRNEISVTRLDPTVVTNVVTNTGANNVVVGFP